MNNTEFGPPWRYVLKTVQILIYRKRCLKAFLPQLSVWARDLGLRIDTVKKPYLLTGYEKLL